MKINLLDIPVYYINMDKDKDKNKNMKSMLKDLGFKKIHRIPGVEDPKSGRRGLSKAQYNALSQVPAPFIVLEDDCDTKYFRQTLEVPDDADAVYLGNSAWGVVSSYSGFFLKYKNVKEYPGIYRIFNMLSSHAILYLKNDYVDMCKRTTYYCGNVSKSAHPMDVPFAEIQKYFNIYCPDKPLFIQRHYEGAMSAAPDWTNGRLTEYRIDDYSRKHDKFHIIDDIL